MYRTALRAAPRASAAGLRTTVTRSIAPRRFASTVPADKPRSWKSSALRWGVAVGAVYYYTASPVFAEEASPQTVPAPASFADADLPTVESVIDEKRKQVQARLEKTHDKELRPSEQRVETSEGQQKEPLAPQQQKSKGGEAADKDAEQVTAVGSPDQLEEEAGQQGAFNPETGEINWDCPCLGGMAHGPCGEDFKTAFSCFVYSEEEPKGMDCIEKFQSMQDCFRQYPDIYGAELADDDDEGAPAEGDDHQVLQESAPPGSAVANNSPETDTVPGADQSPRSRMEDATEANDEALKQIEAEKAGKAERHEG